MFLGRATRLPCSGDDAVALFAAYQFGLLSRAQARRCGLGCAAVAARLRDEEWVTTPYRDVFRVRGFGASAWCPRRTIMAAILAVAPGAFACRETAARLWRLDAPHTGADVVHVGVRHHASLARPPCTGPGRACVRVHVLPVGTDELARHPPFLVTTVRRTLDDLARCTDQAAFTCARDSAVRQGLLTPAASAHARLSLVSRGRSRITVAGRVATSGVSRTHAV